MEKLHPFFRMCIGAFGGASLGMIGGFLLAYCIFLVSSSFDATGSMPPASLPIFLGMGVGSLVGSVLGGIFVNKK